ncbi:MAG: manganese efflux pump [Elusimicrobiaceae bacterium]|nr:manganese efflux pump [Elusimicrobiaceae bacterium]
MLLLSVILISLSLSMDNLAVTVAAGCAAHRRVPVGFALKAGGVFSAAHLIMFTGGWLLGSGVGHYVDAFDHWLAFGILVFIGVRMVKESSRPHNEAEKLAGLAGRTLWWLALATSIDAWLVGMGLSFTQAPFGLTAVILTAFVFTTSWAGFYLGVWLGGKFGQRMEALGGIALALLGVKILLEGLGIW